MTTIRLFRDFGGLDWREPDRPRFCSLFLTVQRLSADPPDEPDQPAPTARDGGPPADAPPTDPQRGPGADREPGANCPPRGERSPADAAPPPASERGGRDADPPRPDRRPRAPRGERRPDGPRDDARRGGRDDAPAASVAGPLRRAMVSAESGEPRRNQMAQGMVAATEEHRPTDARRAIDIHVASVALMVPATTPVEFVPRTAATVRRAANVAVRRRPKDGATSSALGRPRMGA